jgi:hypothetical protein
MTHLQLLLLEGNQLSGEIPHSLTLLTQLRTLYVPAALRVVRHDVQSRCVCAPARARTLVLSVEDTSKVPGRLCCQWRTPPRCPDACVVSGGHLQGARTLVLSVEDTSKVHGRRCWALTRRARSVKGFDVPKQSRRGNDVR